MPVCLFLPALHLSPCLCLLAIYFYVTLERLAAEILVRKHRTTHLLEAFIIQTAKCFTAWIKT